MKDKQIRLTEYSKGAGCGCKISPQVLEEILQNSIQIPLDKLLVGNHSKDDAAVFQLDKENALIATTDFFMPIVDDAFEFGRIAAANAISDVYAMGGKPILAIAILGWPIEKLPASLAKEVIEGARKVLDQIGIPLGGGHTIDSPEPFFGLAVNGMVPLKNLKRNDSAQEGDLLFLTKPVGVGILAAALKRKVISEGNLKILINQLTSLNNIGEELGKIKGVNAMTDVTGYGLIGHLIEMVEGSGLSAELDYSKVQVLEGAIEYLGKKIIPDATYRNWNCYRSKIYFEKNVDVMEAFSILPDPQTNGGLLIAVNPNCMNEVEKVFKKAGLENFLTPIGKMNAKNEKLIRVNQ